MDSLCKIQPSLHLSLHRPSCPKPPFSPRFFPKPPSSKTLFYKTPSKIPKPFSLKASSSSPSSNQHIPSSSSSSSSPPSPPLPSNKNPLPSLAKTISISLVTSAALLLTRFHRNPSIAAAPTTSPPPTVGSRSSDADVAEETEQSLQQEERERSVEQEERERSLEQQLGSEPEDVRSLRELMETKIKLQKIPEAIDMIDRLIALQPNVPDWPLLRAHLHLYGGDINVARSSFEELIAADPFRVEAYHGLAMLALQTEAEDIEQLLKRIEGVMQRCRKENKKALREFKLLEAQVRVIEEKYEEALKIYQGLVKEDPKDFRPYLCQGIIYTLLKKMGEAEKQFEKYRRLVPKGHPYAEYFNENVLATKVFAEMTGKDKEDSRR